MTIKRYMCTRSISLTKPLAFMFLEHFTHCIMRIVSVIQRLELFYKFL